MPSEKLKSVLGGIEDDLDVEQDIAPEDTELDLVDQ